MNIKLIVLGRLKEKYLRDACAEYEKRLTAFCRLTIDEIEPARLPEEPSQAETEKALRAEAEKIRAKIPQGSLVVAMCIEGKQLDSASFAGMIEKASGEGKGTAVFIVGSSYGLSDEIKKAADIRLSMSEMTFPHQLARVMLLEQVYRAFTIINNRKYHK